jgi:hypothetical protein
LSIQYHCQTSPLMTKDRGWGSRPIIGRDWGSSDVCDDTTLNELVAQFNIALNMEGMLFYTQYMNDNNVFN